MKTTNTTRIITDTKNIKNTYTLKDDTVIAVKQFDNQTEVKLIVFGNAIIGYNKTIYENNIPEEIVPMIQNNKYTDTVDIIEPNYPVFDYNGKLHSTTPFAKNIEKLLTDKTEMEKAFDRFYEFIKNI